MKNDEYRIWYDAASETLYLKGFLRLEGMEQYQAVMDVLLQAISNASTCTINLQELEFLNSSGISMLSMFIVKVRERGNLQLTLRGSDKILWQTKSLKNLQRLMPSLKLELS